MMIGKPKQYENPENSGELVEFYLGYNPGMDRGKRYTQTIKVNGYEFTAEFGKKNLLPKNVVKVLQNAQSGVLANQRAKELDSAVGRTGRPSSELNSGQPSYQYVPDYEVQILKEA